jgi:hypothetical protein
MLISAGILTQGVTFPVVWGESLDPIDARGRTLIPAC